MSYRCKGLLKYGLFALIIGCLCGCAGGYYIETTAGEDGSFTVYTVGNEIYVVGGEVEVMQTGSSSLSRFGKKCFLDMKKCQDTNGDAIYYFLFKYIGRDWFNFYSGPSLNLLIDNKSIALSSEGSVKKEKEEYNVCESLQYVVPRNVLYKIAAAEKVEITVSGENGTLYAYFHAENFSNVRRFINECIERNI